ncbi:hypothetical protein [Catenisphaera adipataccumulans]|jgi:hypothetical protein|uniref:Uncharacterized protein n=1 Tax=Catenisphaera adipataccumulans TaxID=700500 RepID=A0A7W8FWK1_9FIRM|nr:hypothetical protein [Catenisphaera adipataccumulans]MBB5182002.1 hypothetical protein [Catenisphaera adipataccumulans]
MKNIVDELKDVSFKKHVVTSIEYDCKDDTAKDEVYEAVHDIIENHLEDFAKITYDLEPDDKVKVEVIENI